MNKKLILGLSTVALLSTSLFANMPQRMDKPNERMNKQEFINIKVIPQRGHHMGRENLISKIMMLDLSQDQLKKVQDILSTENKNFIDPLDAFSTTSFDKDKYLEAFEKNKENMIKDRVEKLSKIYALLTKEQKKDLKTILDMEKLMKKKMKQRFDNSMPKPEFRG